MRVVSVGIWLSLALLALTGCGGGSGGAIEVVNKPPQARFTQIAQSYTAPATVAFNADGSTDGDGSISKYRWDFGDGAEAAGQVVSHIYTEAGSYTVTLTVTDDQGANGSISQTVAVLAPQPSVPVISVSAPHFIAPATVSFDGAESTDPDGGIAAYHWDFDDAGAIGQGATVSHVFEQPGDYAVVLTLTDDTGLLSSLTETVTILPRSAGQFSISGVVRATEQTYVDSDTNDPLSPLVTNNSTFEAQVIGNPSITGGFVAAAATGNTDNGDRFAADTDVSDYYQVSLQAGQQVLLEIGDWNNGDVDLDLYLYDSSGTEVAFSKGVADVEAVQAPASGDYFVEVYAFSGFSNYALSTGISAADVPARAQSMTNLSPIVERQVQLRLKGDGVLSEATRGQRFSVLGLQGQPIAGRLGRYGLTVQNRARALAPGLVANRAFEAKRATINAIKRLRQDPSVAQAAPNYRVVPLGSIPSDPSYVQQWHYPQINLPQAWDYATGSGVVVAVVDTGVYLAHEDLAANLTDGYDFILSPGNSADGDGIDPDPDDPGDGGFTGTSSWHGTHVAGTIAAVAGNGVGGVGVAYGAKIMPLRALGTFGGDSYDILQAMRYAAGLSNDSNTLPATPAKIANLSLGCLFCYSETEAQVYQEVRDAGLIVIAAAGNENSTNPSYPAAYDGVVSVAATDRFDQRAPYSNQSPSVDIAAPGGDQSSGASAGILSSLVDESSGERRSAYAWYQGTSMAAPHVAGVAALMAEIYPQLTPDDFDLAISSGGITIDLGDPGKDDVFGYGRIDAFKAVQYAQQLAGGTLPAAMIGNPGSIIMGSLQSAALIELHKSGSEPLSVVSVTDDAEWLTVTATSVDADGFGSYQISASRALLADGDYRAIVTFTDSNNNTLDVPVYLTQGVQTAQEGAGFLYIMLLDENLNFFDQVQMEPDANGDYNYQFDQLPAAKFYLLAGTDNDNDLEVCDAGEVCGAYPTLGVLTPILINSNITGADFLVLLGDAISQSSTNSKKTRKEYKRKP